MSKTPFFMQVAISLIAFTVITPALTAAAQPPGNAGQNLRPPTRNAVVVDPLSRVVQRDHPFALEFDTPVKPTVRIGPVSVPYHGEAAKKVLLTIPGNATVGEQPLTVEAQGKPLPNTGTLLVVPPIASLEMGPNDAQGRTDETQVAIRFTGTLPDIAPGEVQVRVGSQVFEGPAVQRQGNRLVVVPANLPEGTVPVQVAIRGITLEPSSLALRIGSPGPAFGYALLLWLLLISIVGSLFARARKIAARAVGGTSGSPQSPPGLEFGWFGSLLLEPQNKTLSLSRFQFVWWFGIMSLAYIFVSLSRWLVDGVVGFPPSGGFPYAFLISLGTLVGAQAINTSVGVKGAGSVTPSVSDLVMNGGVLALDRVQQLVWTIIGGTGFLLTTILTYTTVKHLPTIPNDLLLLMGLSSAGYLGAKFTRQPGPIIEKVIAREEGLTIQGVNLAQKVDVRIWIGKEEITQNRETFASSTAQDPETPSDGYVASLSIALPGRELKDLIGQQVRVLNRDEQFADCVVETPSDMATAPLDATLPEYTLISLLRACFGEVPEAVMEGVAIVVDPASLSTLTDFVATDCPDIEAFQAKLAQFVPTV